MSCHYVQHFAKMWFLKNSNTAIINQGWVQANDGLSWHISGNENMGKKIILTWMDDLGYFHNEFEYGVKRRNVGK